MGSLSLTISYAKNTGLVLNASELKQLYFTGIKLEDQYQNPISNETIEFYIEAAQKELEDYLSIKLTRQAYQENRDYMFDDWIQWGYIPTTYPVVSPISLKGFLNTTLQVDYPSTWLSAKGQSNDEGSYHRSISTVPVQGTASIASGNSVYVGLVPLSSRFGSKTVPNYWASRYSTGFNVIPADILAYIGKMAAMNILALLNELISGQPGVSNKSISIDGVSQTVNSQAGYAARIKLYQTETTRTLPLLSAKYRGFIFGSLG